MDDDYKPNPVSDEMMEDTFTIPTVVVNRFVVNTTSTSFRFSFGESRNMESPIHWRIALLMTPYEALELRNVIDTLLKPFYAEWDAAAKSTAEQPADQPDAGETK